MNVYEQILILSTEELHIKSITDLIVEWLLPINYLNDDTIYIIFDDRERLDFFYNLLCKIKDDLFLLNTCYNL